MIANAGMREPEGHEHPENKYSYMSSHWITTCATQIRDDEGLNYIESNPELGC